MSSRVYRRIHGKDELKSLHDDLAKNVLNDEVHSDSDSEDVIDTGKTNSKNLFALALHGDDGEQRDDTDSGKEDIEPNKEFTDSPKPKTSAKTKKKKKKNKKKKEELDFDTLLQQLGSTQQQAHQCEQSTIQNFNPLSVLLRNLNPEYEMKKKFGQKVVKDESRKKSHKTYKKAYHLVLPKNDWRPITKSGLEMNVTGQNGEMQTFCIEHKVEYQRVQQKFWDAVDSMSPDNLMAILNAYPYHVDTLLQLSEVCRMSEDPQMASELIERALYAYESCFHPLFNLTTGKCHLSYKMWENRGLFIALFRHIQNIGNRGCYRTSLECCKLLLGLDADMDPLCVLLMIDFYALRSDEYDYLIQLYQIWDGSRNLRVLPNFAFSVPLAMFHISDPESAIRENANQMLQESLMMFPGVLQPLLDACGVNIEDDKNINKFFGPTVQYSQPPSLKQLANLYVGRTSSCWKAPECISWLEENVQVVCAAALSDGESFEHLTSKGRNLYRGKAPLNVCRHLLMSEIKQATADLPAEVTSASVLSYDPLPPPDTIRSYDRRENRPRRIENQGFLSAFLNSFRPDFDVNAVLEHDEAVGGADGEARNLRQGIGDVMEALRGLLNNIEFIPGPRDDGGDDVPPQNFD